MRAVVQLVNKASVTVSESIISEIGPGLVVLLGVHKNDTPRDAKILAAKIAHLRIFPDEGKLMNLSVLDVGGEMLVVSQFTLYGDCRKGRRPGFVAAARPEEANRLYESFVAEVRGTGIKVETGRFQEHMDVELVNDGPVTLLLDSRRDF